jgi:hypothetical protein
VNSPTRFERLKGESADDLRRQEFLGVLVMFDGGTALADLGLVSIVDEDGVAFQRFLHEIGPRYLPPNEPA